jgi:uncharacterized phage protein (TIGR02218 family)
MLRLDLSDGTALGFTDHDFTINHDLGDGAIDYSPATGMFSSDVALREGFDADNFETSGPLETLVSRVAVLGGRFNRARARLFEVNWSALADGEIRQLEGNIAEARLEAGKFVFSIRSNLDRYNQVIGRLITNICSADHGDALCGRTVETEAATVSAVTDAMRFTVTFAGSYADDYFNLGKAVFTGGDLAGIMPVHIFDWTAGGAITLLEPLPTVPEISDTLTLHRGCPRTRQGCMDRDNIAQARAFFEVPGTENALKVPVPGAGGA